MQNASIKVAFLHNKVESFDVLIYYALEKLFCTYITI